MACASVPNQDATPMTSEYRFQFSAAIKPATYPTSNVYQQMAALNPFHHALKANPLILNLPPSNHSNVRSPASLSNLSPSITNSSTSHHPTSTLACTSMPRPDTPCVVTAESKYHYLRVDEISCDAGLDYVEWQRITKQLLKQRERHLMKVRCKATNRCINQAVELYAQRYGVVVDQVFGIDAQIEQETLSKLLSKIESWQGVRLNRLKVNEMNSFKTYYVIGKNWLDQNKKNVWSPCFWIRIFQHLHRYAVNLAARAFAHKCSLLQSEYARCLELQMLACVLNGNVQFAQTKKQPLIPHGTIKLSKSMQDYFCSHIDASITIHEWCEAQKRRQRRKDAMENTKRKRTGDARLLVQQIKSSLNTLVAVSEGKLQNHCSAESNNAGDTPFCADYATCCHRDNSEEPERCNSNHNRYQPPQDNQQPQQQQQQEQPQQHMADMAEQQEPNSNSNTIVNMDMDASAMNVSNPISIPLQTLPPTNVPPCIWDSITTASMPPIQLAPPNSLLPPLSSPYAFAMPNAYTDSQYVEPGTPPVFGAEPMVAHVVEQQDSASSNMHAAATCGYSPSRGAQYHSSDYRYNPMASHCEQSAMNALPFLPPPVQTCCCCSGLPPNCNDSMMFHHAPNSRSPMIPHPSSYDHPPYGGPYMHRQPFAQNVQPDHHKTFSAPNAQFNAAHTPCNQYCTNALPNSSCMATPIPNATTYYNY